ncbi:MAG: FecR family protein [Jaaginema sp. PMC 1079.18]|nr:FecR family protein [Jaaginema sp. PMC 1080.18]MEC4852603.1 FecR family protein [Jaaginema sp. PMC 1079.18]MEC4866177.1 FecR family protein [Jaaginema sp. PMC 1078.18]
MFRQLSLILALAIAPVPALVISTTAQSQTTLTQGTLAAVRNQVRLLRQNQSPRAARTSDTIRPGDGLATAAASTADIRFNDSSLARLGEQTMFRFAPRLRAVDLTNGTVLLLIRPGSGGTSVRTPNAAAGIRGSALFVRYIRESNTTLIGALTTSGITAFNGSGTQSVELQGGQMAAVVGDRIERVYNFDLRTFYETNTLAAGLELTATTESSDPMLTAVRAEITTALASQAPLTEATVNPALVRLPSQSSPEFPDNTVNPVEFEFFAAPQEAIANNSTIINPLDIRSGLTVGEVQFNSPVLLPSGIATSGTTTNTTNNRGGIRVFPGQGNTNGIFPGRGSFPPSNP